MTKRVYTGKLITVLSPTEKEELRFKIMPDGSFYDVTGLTMKVANVDKNNILRFKQKYMVKFPTRIEALSKHFEFEKKKNSSLSGVDGKGGEDD